MSRRDNALERLERLEEKVDRLNRRLSFFSEQMQKTNSILYKMIEAIEKSKENDGK